MTATQDSEPEDPAEAVARLEQALDRIAARAAQPAPAPAPTAALAERLDGVIAKLRAGLGPDAA